MSGLGEILEENANLREIIRLRELQTAAQLAAAAEQVATRDEQMAAQGQQVAAQGAQIATLLEQIEALKASNERFAKHLEFLEKRRQLAAAERFDASERQSPLFEGLAVDAPARDPEIEEKEAGNDENEKQDKRKTAKHPRKGRRDVSALPFPKRRVEAPVNPSTCEKCHGDRQLRATYQPSGRLGARSVHRRRGVPGALPVLGLPEGRDLDGAGAVPAPPRDVR